jgi:hypothetical protein
VIWTSSPRRRLQLTLALLVGLIVIGTILAHTHGAKPDAGATYTGTVIVETQAGRTVQQLPFSFEVATSGQEVAGFRLPAGVPTLCSKSTSGADVAADGSGSITNPSHFRVNLPIIGAGHRVGTLEISGSFHTLHRESGAVATRYSSSRLRDCDASGGYATRSSS